MSTKLTDDEFEAKVEELRQAFKEALMKGVGGEDKLFSANQAEFMDAYSVGAYGTMSIMATLASMFMVRLVHVEGFTKEQAIKEVGTIYHIFLHEILDRAKENMEQNLQHLKNLKTMN